MSVLGSPLSPTSSSGRKHGSDRHTGFWTVREFIRQGLAAQKDEKAKSAAKDAHDASVIQAQNMLRRSWMMTARPMRRTE